MEGAQALVTRASVVAALGLRSCGSWVWSAGLVVGAQGLVAPWRMESSWTRDQARVPCTGRRVLLSLRHQGGPSTGLLMKCLLRSWTHFLIGHFVFSLLSFKISLMFWITILYQIFLSAFYQLISFFLFRVILLNAFWEIRWWQCILLSSTAKW